MKTKIAVHLMVGKKRFRLALVVRWGQGRVGGREVKVEVVKTKVTVHLVEGKGSMLVLALVLGWGEVRVGVGIGGGQEV